MTVARCAETGKISHVSRGKAEAALRALVKKTPDYNGHVFPCACCAGWHVGRLKKRAHQNKYLPVLQ